VRLCAQGDMYPRQTADSLEAILARDSLNAAANWRAAIALVDVGKQTPDKQKDRVRDSLYRRAEFYASFALCFLPILIVYYPLLALTTGGRVRAWIFGQIFTGEAERMITFADHVTHGYLGLAFQ